MAWQTLRTFATQAAEGTGAPSAGTFVALADAGRFAIDQNRIPFIEVAFDSLVLSGAPTSVTFAIWRSSDGSLDRMGSLTLAATDVGIAPPITFDFGGEQVWVTVEGFSGGASPAVVSGKARVRPVRASSQRFSDKNPLPTAVVIDTATLVLDKTGLATSTKQDAVITALPAALGQARRATSLGVVLPVDTFAGAITAADATGAPHATPTAGSSVTIPAPSAGSILVQGFGAYTGIVGLVAEGTNAGTAAAPDWTNPIALQFVPLFTVGALSSISPADNSTWQYMIANAGFVAIRLRAPAYGSGSLSIKAAATAMAPHFTPPQALPLPAGAAQEGGNLAALTAGAKAIASSLSVTPATSSTWDIGDRAARLLGVVSKAARAPAVPAAPTVASNVVLSVAAATCTACAGYLDSTAPTGTYYVQLIDASAPVTGGLAITCLAAPIKIQHTLGVDDYWTFGSALPADGVSAANGIVVQLSTTLPTGTLAGAYLVAGGAK